MKWSLLLILLGIIKTSHTQWVEVYNFPENGFSNLYFFDEFEGMVLQKDKIFKTYDSGESWSLIDTFPSNYFFWHMDFYGDTGMIVGSMSGNQGLYTVDRGEHWVGLIPPDITYHNIDLLNGHEYYKTPLADPHFVYCNIEEGFCDDTLIGPDVLLMNDIEIIDSDTIYVCASPVGPGPGLYKTTNAGTDWQPIDVDVLAFIEFPTAQTGYGIALDYIVKTSNYGGDWNQITLIDSVAAIAHPFFLSSEVGYAVYESINDNSGILKTIDGLASAELTPFPSEEMEFNSDGINSLFCLDEMNCWCVTNYGKVFKTTNGGEGGVVIITDITENYTQGEFLVYPNPTSDLLHIYSTDGKPFNPVLYNIFGQLCEFSKLNDPSGLMTINISHLSSGIYYLAIDNETLTTFKIVKL